MRAAIPRCLSLSDRTSARPQVCRRLNIDALHPRSFHMVLALLSKTDARLELFHLVRAGDAGVILDMEVAEQIESLQPELLYSVSVLSLPRARRAAPAPRPR